MAPWSTESEAYKHNHKAKGKKSRQWLHVANSEMESGKDDGTAIRIANGVIKKKSALAELMDLAKGDDGGGIGNDLVSNKIVNVRPYERKMMGRKVGFNVNQQRKVRLDTKSMKKKEETDE